MNEEILKKDHLIYFHRAMETQRKLVLTVMADAVSECRAAQEQETQLSENGQIGLLRLVEIWSVIHSKYGKGGLVLEGTEIEILSHVLVQLYAFLTGSIFGDPAGLSAYVELHQMLSSLMLGEWFE